MKTTIFLSIILTACIAFAAYKITEPQPLARSLSEEQLEAVLAKTPSTATVTLPAHLLVKKQQDVNQNLMLMQFQQIIADTRSNIVECATMSDIEIAELYIKQMTKSADQIVAPTNTLEYLIGAGMREDIATEAQNAE